MNQRQMELVTLLFGNPERIPFSPGGGRESTRANGYNQGLPRDVPITLEAYRQAGGKASLNLFKPAVLWAEGPLFPSVISEKAWKNSFDGLLGSYFSQP